MLALFRSAKGTVARHHSGKEPLNLLGGALKRTAGGWRCARSNVGVRVLRALRKSVLWRNVLWLCALVSLWGATLSSLHAAADVNSLPKPSGYVSDLAHVVDPADKETLEALCTRVQQQLGVQFALVTIDTIGDTPIENFSLDLARAWGVGSKKDNSGVLLLLVIKGHKSRVEVGRGVEPNITDGFAGSTLRSMRPQLRAGNYGAALLEGAREMAAEIAQGKGINFDEGTGLPSREHPVTEHPRGIPLGQILFGIFILLFVLSLFRRGGGGGYRGGGGGGFWTGVLLSSLLNSGRRGGDWGGGGFGGSSGGGGGFGGFGGGDFGGGGASSDW